MNFIETFFLKKDNNIAYIDNDKTVTYGQLKNYVRNSFKFYQNNSFLPGDRVAIVSDDSYVVVSLILAGFAYGVQTFVLPKNLPIIRLQEILSDSKTKKIFYDGTDLKDTDFEIQSLSNVETFIKQEKCSDITFYKWKEDEIAMFLSTTGSSGKSKLVCHSISNVYHGASILAGALDLQEGDVIYCGPKLSFTYGYTINLMANLYAGSTAILHNGPTSPNKIEKHIDKYNINYLFVVPSVAGLLCKIKKTLNLSNLKRFISAGDHLPEHIQKIIQKKHGAILINMIGMAEVCGWYTVQTPNNCRFGSIGQIIPGLEFKLTNKKLLVKIPSAGLKYLNDEELSKKVFNGQWVDTGDNAEVDLDNFLYFKGRNVNVFKVNAYHISAVEIEDALLLYPGIENSIIRCEKNDLGLPMLVADIVVSKPVDISEIKTFLKTRLETYKVPKIINFIDAVPLNHNGKKMRPIFHVDK